MLTLLVWFDETRTEVKHILCNRIHPSVGRCQDFGIASFSSSSEMESWASQVMNLKNSDSFHLLPDHECSGFTIPSIFFAISFAATFFFLMESVISLLLWIFSVSGF